MGLVAEAFEMLQPPSFVHPTDLRSKTQGRAVSTMQFAHYDPVPNSVQEEIVAKSRGK